VPDRQGIAKARIETALRTRARELHLRDLELEELPPSIGKLVDLELLRVDRNRLTTLPECLGQLTRLRVLGISNNLLTHLPDSVGQLSGLEALTASDNMLTGLPDSVGRLGKLSTLWLDGNDLQSLPETLRQLRNLDLLVLRGNEALGLPPEVLNSESPARILEYYFSKRISRPLNEAKMLLVGRGGVGKTSLVNRLVHGRYDPDQGKTDGIAITPWPVAVGGDRVRLNVWDFGGQEIMHATHQFFLTKRSLYLLVLNAREGEQDANVEYWLELVESFGGGSPVLVVINKIREYSAPILNRRGLQAKFPSIAGFIETDCAADQGLDDLRNAVVRETDRLEHVRDPFPESWFAVKETLADLPKAEGRNFIPYSRYQQLCVENGIREATGQETLVDFLHDLGIVVNFREDPRLAETHVLDPEWVTKGIYKILTADRLAREHGELRLTELAALLDPAAYPRQMHLYLLDLMRKFELCYEFYDSAGHYLVPELLPKEEPDLKEFSGPDTLHFEFRYNILPEGLLPRFIVRSRALNRDLQRWRTGVVLQWDGNRAVVKADVQGKSVSVAIIGPAAGRRRLLSVIRADLDHIHRSVARLHAEERVPVPMHPGLVIRYKTLQAFEAAGERQLKVAHDDQVIVLDVPTLIDGVEERPPRIGHPAPDLATGSPVKIVFSYSHRDEELRDQLETHLKLLQRNGLISSWHDRKILGGEKWAGVIDDNFKRADLVLPLLSADFLASEYCYETEMKLALDRHARGEVEIVPIVLRACDWTGSSLGHLQARPTNARPVTSWDNRDEAWVDVAVGIKAVVEALRTRR
jgi:internalin A